MMKYLHIHAADKVDTHNDFRPISIKHDIGARRVVEKTFRYRYWQSICDGRGASRS